MTYSYFLFIEPQIAVGAALPCPYNVVYLPENSCHLLRSQAPHKNGALHCVNAPYLRNTLKTEINVAWGWKPTH